MKRITTVVFAALAATLVVSASAVPASALLLPVTYLVLNTNDAGPDSLRDVITQANGNAGTDTIEFDIPVGGVKVITLATDLPPITDSIQINGYTQRGAAQAVPGTPADLRVVLNATNVAYGLDLRANDIVVEGLVIRSSAGPVAVGATCVNDGICVTGANNVIRGNYIGVGYAGMTPLGNDGDGIEINGDGNTVGGTRPGDRNVISDNQSGGIDINGAYNVVQGNLIGVNAIGRAVLGNGGSVEVSGNNNTVGGATEGARNVISGSAFDGVLIDGDDNVVEGNWIGIDESGLTLLANNKGVHVRSGAGNRIGGTATGTGTGTGSGTGNLISCTSSCVYISQATGTTIRGNLIGMDRTGLASFAGGGGDTGIEVDSVTGTVIGGNVIAGMRVYGMDIDGDGTVVEDNKVGTNAAGTAALGNNIGIRLTNDNIRVGGPAVTQGNLISGNVSDGVFIDADDNIVEGNLIGADVTGLLPLGNGGAGVNIDSGSHSRVGGSAAGARNVIADNGGDGVLLDGTGQLVEGNLIGIAANGITALGNTGNGIRVHGVTHGIGGITNDARNVISANGGAGVFIETDARDVQILGNAIGTDATLTANRGNGASGVFSDGLGILIGSIVPNAAPNVIAHNNGDGITVGVPQFGPSSTAMAHNVLYANTGLGIDLNPNGVTANDAMDADTGANGLQNFPVINSATTVTGVTTITWSFNSLPSSQFRIEFFTSGVCDGSGHGEGRLFLGEIVVMTSLAGNMVGTSPMTVAAAVGQPVVATATLLTGAAAADATSEFSACVTVV